MLFWESSLLALQGLWSNKIRLFLTMIGIVIGVGAVIAMVSIGLSEKTRMEKYFSSIGTNSIEIYSRGDDITASKLSRSDAAAIAKLPMVKVAIPEINFTPNIINGSKNWSKRVAGIFPEYYEIHNVVINTGRFINSADGFNKNRVVVLGRMAAKALFDNNAVGEFVRINENYFQVIGVCSLPIEEFWPQAGDVAFVPFTTAREYMGSNNGDFVDLMTVQAKAEADVSELETAVTELLRVRHGISSGRRDDFHINNMVDHKKRSEEEVEKFVMFLVFVAALSLFVGGVGIMNIMLIAVTQRTKEIGIRKAIGATYWSILMQFLIEALIISGVGALLGIICGVALTYIADVFLKEPVMFSIPAIFVAAGSALVVGLFFGIYPAHRAALLNPVEALHYEG